ncbi:MAG: DUF115 domain-containing protein [Lachnospiraceae bacterium]|nr:DUF115 domain-containing protein [Lachnospiraceae bacterium]
MRIVIRGVGERGQKLFRVLPREDVVAFVDGDRKKQGSEFEGTPIVSQEMYEKEYYRFPIVNSILSVTNPKESDMDDFPPYIVESQINLIAFFNSISDELKAMSEPIVIYGDNLFSLYLFDYVNNLKKNVFILNDNGCDSKLKRNDELSVISDEVLEQYENATILVTNPRVEFVRNKYRKYRVEDYYNFNIRYPSSINKRLSELKNTHIGETCIIIGNGPSLSISDLDKISDSGMFSFGVNQVYRVFAKTKWRPSCYVSDEDTKTATYVKELESLNLPCMIIGDKVNIKKEGDSIYRCHASSNGHKGNNINLYSDDVSRVIYSGGTILYYCLQIATYMGFDQIYLLGADCNYSSDAPNKNYFIENYVSNEEVEYIYFPTWEVFGSYQVAKSYAEKRGIRIYNATRGGKLEVFERVDFDSLFEEE